MIWDAGACNLHLEMLVMQKVLNHENRVILMTFFPIFVILILIWFFDFFSFVENTDWLSLSGRRDNSCNLILFVFAKLFRDSLRVYVLFDHLKILEWWHESRLTFNQSTKILIIGFSFKNFHYSAQQEKHKALGSIVRPLEGWQWIVTLWYVTKWNFPDLRS